MTIRKILTIAASLFAFSTASADLEPWTDYELSDDVWTVTTVKVDSNMENAYLEGIQKTWAAAMNTQKELGFVEDYYVYLSELPNGGEFNMLLVVRFADDDMLGPNRERYEAFMKEYGKARQEEGNEYAQKNYPAMRTITGEYRFRRVEFK